LAINVSSPNTPGLRELQHGRYLTHLLSELQTENEKLSLEHGLTAPRPLLLKISPDLSWSELDDLLSVACSEKVAGIIATNTSLNVPDGAGRQMREKGGLSGMPLRERSNEVIARISRETEGKLPIVGVGGVRTAADVQAKLEAGASLIQLYTGLVYEGPGVAGRILRSLT